MDAATEVFLELGFAGASVAEIARRSGASKQTLYALFPSKAALFKGLMHRYLDASATPVQIESIDFQRPIDELLESIATRAVNGILDPQRQDLYRLIISESDRFPDVCAEFWDKGPGRARFQFKKLLDRLVAENLLVIEDTGRAVDQFLGSMLWAPLVRFTLRLELPFKNTSEAEPWIKNAVAMFICGHLPENAIPKRAVRSKMRGPR